MFCADTRSGSGMRTLLCGQKEAAVCLYRLFVGADLCLIPVLRGYLARPGPDPSGILTQNVRRWHNVAVSCRVVQHLCAKRWQLYHLGVLCNNPPEHTSSVCCLTIRDGLGMVLDSPQLIVAAPRSPASSGSAAA